MNLHDKIMNIRVNLTELASSLYAGDTALAYKVGHRDARHAAAELASEADALIAELGAALRAIAQFSEYEPAGPAARTAQAAIAKLKATK